MATPPPFPSTSIPPPSVAKLLDDRKLHLLNGRILDNQNNSGGGVVSGFGSSPNYKAQPAEMSQSTLEDNFPPGSSKVQTALFSSSDFGLPEEKTPTPLPTESSDSRSKSHASRGELKLSGEKRPLPADTDDHSVITLESTPRDEEASRERKIRDRKSPKQAKTNPLIVEDIDLVQSNPGGEFLLIFSPFFCNPTWIGFLLLQKMDPEVQFLSHHLQASGQLYRIFTPIIAVLPVMETMQRRVSLRPQQLRMSYQHQIPALQHQLQQQPQPRKQAITERKKPPQPQPLSRRVLLRQR